MRSTGNHVLAGNAGNQIGQYLTEDSNTGILTVNIVRLCFVRLLQVWLKLGWELSLEHSWRGVGVDETLLVGLLRQRMLVWGPGESYVGAVCMLGAALVVHAVWMVCSIG